MRTQPRRDGRSAVALIASIVIGACTIEVNINTNPDDEPQTPLLAAEATAPTPAAPTPAPEVTIPAPPAPPLMPLQPRPPVVVAPEPSERWVRDALLRYYDEDRTPPPPVDLSEDLSQEPQFTPFTAAPSVLNRAEVVAALQDEYPPLLRDAGIGGTVVLFFFIEADGSVQSIRLEESSGHPALDDAALRVAEIYRFSPALNRDREVPVWVMLPITFKLK